MECFECKKQLKSGFGVGPKPYIYFRCADCVLEKVDRQTLLHGYQLILEKTSGVVKQSKGYKAKFEELLSRINSVNVIANYYIDRAKQDMKEVENG